MRGSEDVVPLALLRDGRMEATWKGCGRGGLSIRTLGQRQPMPNYREASNACIRAPRVLFFVGQKSGLSAVGNPVSLPL
jgi:hypothetical protein